MVSRNIYLQLILRIILISLSALLLAFFYFKTKYVLSGFFLLILVLQTIFLIQYINQTNRKIAYFFDAIKNEDFTLRFPEKLSVKSLEELNHSLNMLNAMIQEIHLKKQAQEQYYQEIIKQAAIGILTINSKGHILFANRTIEKLLNYHPLNHIKQFNQIDPKLYALFADIQPFEGKIFQLANERENSQLALKATAITVDGKSLLLVVVQDIHKELDEKETDSWVRLIRVLTHEIMNTITPITSISESILKYYKGKNGLVSVKEFNEEQISNTVKGLEVIKEQGGDLMQFVQSYRSFLSLPKPDKALVSAQRLLDKVLLLMNQENVQGKVDFKVQVKPKDLELFIDEKQITQNLVNLSKNALQSLGEKENAMIKLSSGITRQGKKFIEVWDNGPGIPPELIDEIFVPFFTTKTTGTGIGLSLSKQIMHLHGGSIKVHSAPSRGTSFVMTFA
ncbi:histidine kinase [Flavobacteriaceae bacterium TP-CH-4]|uniref:histidine kinase n=1 Tax=Pelagihabitans pacificus TaxID=2696054 RepID=A0A967EE13_9FLAO|nr:ATP-binding protein [Pelagihabitans pacificus]NHF59913.1 histidine kinase [Pelagihabitans pacificus]